MGDGERGGGVVHFLLFTDLQSHTIHTFILTRRLALNGIKTLS